ncbi:MAG: hypothetical protein QOJ13_1722 [Gaiellales bacterium]|jgi:hypothetical protein|nr:hypothetical protein [Gaiellales bacterium]
MAPVEGMPLAGAGQASGPLSEPLRHGDLWETSIPEIRAQALTLAASVRNRVPVPAAAAPDWCELQLA